MEHEHFKHICFWSKLSSDKNCEIHVLFSIFRKSNNYAFADNITPTATGCPVFRFRNCYWGAYEHFFLRGVDFCLRIFYTVSFSWWGKFPRVKFSGTILHWGNLPEFLCIFFFFFFFIVIFCSCRLNLTCRDIPGKLLAGLKLPGGGY